MSKSSAIPEAIFARHRAAAGVKIRLVLPGAADV
jgi:hypothetical protein